MEYRNLGNSGLKVSAVSLGTNAFSLWADEPTSISIVNHALDLGVNFIDTADVYGRQQSELFVGKALKGKRSQVIIATKFGLPMGEGLNERGTSRHHIMSAVEASLRRLDTDYIDLYQIHWPDPTVPIEQTLRALDDLVRDGKVRYIGCANFAAWQLCEALWTSKSDNLHPFLTVQSQYNLIDRSIEPELVPCCLDYGIGIIPWYPLAAGFLTGKYRRGEALAPGSRLTMPQAVASKIVNEANFDKLAKLTAFASERGHSVAELAIAWLLAHPWLNTVIVGATKIEQVSANVAALEWKLTDEEMTQLDDISQGSPGNQGPESSPA